MRELFGRTVELAVIARFLSRAQHSGDILLIRGEPGVGKSALLESAARHAEATGMQVLRAAGSEPESGVGYSGLNQLLLPLRDDLGSLLPGYQQALTVALGLTYGPPPRELLVGNAALSLVVAVAMHRPVLLVVDDVQWLDRDSIVALGFMSRRFAGHPVGVLIACRTGGNCPLDRRGLNEQLIEPLDRSASEQLIDTQFPHLPTRFRQRVLELANGSPLALVALAESLADSPPLRADDADLVTLDDRLPALFSSQIADLPEPTRRLLLVAALDDAGDVGLLREIAGAHRGLADLAPAERARLVHVDDRAHRITFGHPLIRSTLVAMSTHEERRGAHRALAESPQDGRDQRAWHRAAAVDGPDEVVAAALDRAAHRTLIRGDAPGAVSALVRAAELSTSTAQRGRRLAEAAYIGAESDGSAGAADALLAQARQEEPDATGSLHAANATVFLMLNADGDVDTAHRFLLHAITTTDHGFRADDIALVEAMHTLLLLSWYACTPAHWESFFAALHRMTPAPPDVLALTSRTFVDPVRTGVAAAPELDRLLATLATEDDPTRIVRIGAASVYLDRLADTREAHWRVVRQGRRSGGSSRRHIGALMHLCLDGYLSGRWDEVDALAHEGQTLCERTGFTFFRWYFHYNRALIAVGRGHTELALALSDELGRWAKPRGVTSVLLYAHHARSLAASASSDFDAAFQHAAAMSPVGSLRPYVPQCTWVMFDLVEAALRTGRHEEARAHLDAMQRAAVSTLSPRMQLIQCGVEALVREDDAADTRLEEMLGSGDCDRWLFDASRIRLAHAESLRRRKIADRPRRHLLDAQEGFAALGAQPWLLRTRQELHNTGFRHEKEPSASSTPLTAQESQIAHLAASGLTNRQIAERLYLSHRTVGAHLYRIFPKLGVTSRAGLRDALSATAGPVTRRHPRTH